MGYVYQCLLTDNRTLTINKLNLISLFQPNSQPPNAKGRGYGEGYKTDTHC